MRTVSEIANEVADEIERKGHWRDGKPLPWLRKNAVCVINSDAYFKASYGDEKEAFIVALGQKIAPEANRWQYLDKIIQWNDSNRKKTVVDTLRSL